MSNVNLKRPTMNVEQAREFLGYAHRVSVYRALEDGRLEGYRIGIKRGVRIYRDTVERLKAAAIERGY